MKNMFVKIAAVIAFAAAPVAYAQDAESALAKNECKNDVKTYCAGLATGSGQIQSCLNANADKLTDVCKAAVAKSAPAAAPADTMQQPAAEPQASPPK
jgi:hypothetical protein